VQFENSDLYDRCMDRQLALLTNNTTIQIRDRHAILQASRLTSPSFKDSSPFVSLEPRLSTIRVQAGIGLGNSQSYHTCQRRVSATTSVPAHSNCACTQTHCPTLSRCELCAAADTYQESSGLPYFDNVEAQASITWLALLWLKLEDAVLISVYEQHFPYNFDSKTGPCKTWRMQR
jgi:hypothetical protein